MAHLFTHHDPLHAHAVFGALTLLQFIYRWFLLIVYGNGWRSSETISFRLMTIVIHLVTPLLSFKLPLPFRRNMSAPMIWPEFRYHSLLFSMRHVFACCAAMTLSTIDSRILQFVIVHVTMICGSIVSMYLGDPQCRTTNAMPYPKTLSHTYVLRIKNFYTYSQMFATAMSMSGNTDLAYMPLLAIQMAPLLMTLVRKHLIRGVMYHIVYSCALAAPVIGMVAISFLSIEGTNGSFFTLICGFIARNLRVHCEIDKHITWVIAPAVSWTIVYITPYNIAFPVVMAGNAYMFVFFAARTRPLVDTYLHNSN